jgi:hypothetical protein
LTEINRERAERIARSVACPSCGEYSFKKLKVTEASESHKETLGEVWHATKTCGVCGAVLEIGIDGEGDIVYGE